MAMGTVLIDKLLQTVVNQKASDLHLTVGQPPVVRLDQHLRRLETKVLDGDDMVALMKSITPERCQQELQEVGSTDFGFAFGEQSRFRVAVFKQRGYIAIVLRRIPNKFMGMDEMGLPQAMKVLIERPRGLVIVTGPTGSGKTTSLAGMINHINENFDHHIITIEDPIEYYHQHKKSTVNQREIGVDVPSFAEAIRRALRQDPDVILVGEMRDLDTMAAAVTAAETGHLVFGTLHTTGSAGTINRIVDAFPEEQQAQIRTQLSVAVIAVLSQVLMPRKKKGMVAGFELMVNTPAVANLIRENKTYRIDSSIQTGKKEGMILLDDHLLELYARGIVEEDDVVHRARNPAALRARIAEQKGLLPEGTSEKMRQAEAAAAEKNAT